MKTIRKDVFETNSSSTHSVSISSQSDYFNNLVPWEFDNKVHCSCGEFGWEVESYSDPMSKLSYALTMVAETEGIEDFEDTEGFNLINDVIAQECHCRGVAVELSSDNFYPYGYIDHQSYESYRSLEDFLNDYGVDLREFIFNPGIILHTDNDNH